MVNEFRDLLNYVMKSDINPFVARSMPEGFAKWFNQPGIEWQRIPAQFRLPRLSAAAFRLALILVFALPATTQHTTGCQATNTKAK